MVDGACKISSINQSINQRISNEREGGETNVKGMRTRELEREGNSEAER